jgi:methyl-accepting chemotaxis protein
MRYALLLVVPPLAVAFPAAYAFLVTVTRVPPIVAALAGVAYAAGAFVAALLLARAARSVDAAVEQRRDPSDAVSAALAQTTIVSAVIWVGWGLIIAMAACAVVQPTLLGLQYFAEAALIMAAPAMAWSYWSGKRMLIARAHGSAHLAYTGRTWSVGIKIAIVFIGFSVVSTGALVLVIASRVAQRLGDEAAYEIGRFGFGIALVTSIIFAIATWYLAHDVTRPLQSLMRLAADMAEGRFSTEPRIFSDDEVGRLASSFITTRKNLRTLIDRVGERGETVTHGVRAMSEGTSALVDNAHEQNGMAIEAAKALSAVQLEAQSVLREVEGVAELTYDSAGRAGELRASFTEVAQRMDDLFQSVEKSSSAAIEIDAAAGESAHRTMTLSGIGSDVLAFVAEMDATVGEIMRTAQSTADLSQQVRSNAETGRAAVEATVEAIRSTQESTRRTAGAFESLQQSLGRIDSILAFIDDVTNRTNLLSLNAAIIAAQAGTNDFGFSVIADEVRQLADRTRNATKEIAGIIRNVQPVAHQAVEALNDGMRNVDRTVSLAHNASGALELILGSADRSQEMVRSISHALEEQAKGSRHLHGTAARMSDNLAEMHRATQGQAEATRMLAVEAERVRDIALQVKRATGEQTSTGAGIAKAMEQIASDVRTIRDRLDRQLHQAEQVAGASRVTLTIAERNNSIAEEFRSALESLLQSGQDFENAVAQFRG